MPSPTASLKSWVWEPLAVLKLEKAPRTPPAQIPTLGSRRAGAALCTQDTDPSRAPYPGQPWASGLWRPLASSPCSPLPTSCPSVPQTRRPPCLRARACLPSACTALPTPLSPQFLVVSLNVALDSPGGWNKIPHTGWLINGRNSFLAVPEAGSPRLGCPRGGVLVTATSRVLSPRCVPRDGTAKRAHGLSFTRGLYPRDLIPSPRPTC